MTLEKIIELITAISLILPVVINIVALVAAKSNNQKVLTLTNRAEIIVSALQRALIDNDVKKQIALEKLTIFAHEAGIKLSTQQAEDYIERAVTYLKQNQKQ